MNAAGFGLADFELYHSRPIAPTRRLALGLQYLPANPAPGPGGLLLAGIVAAFGATLDEDDRAELSLLMQQVESGFRIVQPRLRHRLQRDRVGLLKSHHRLDAGSDGPDFNLTSGTGSPLVHALGAVYAAGNLPAGCQADVFGALRKALRWTGALDARFVAHISGGGATPAGWRALGSDPVAWALSVLGFAEGEDPTKRDIRRQYRDALRVAHPDHGGDEGEAAERIAELSEARRILLG
ncbi:MAG: J domain-containing protein [Acidimicrobiales bacterium]|nr:J domain-containing protein [Acidimicrobiales bacterium]